MMAYPYYPTAYNPNYFGNSNFYPQTAPTMAVPRNSAPNTQNGVIWVQGETGAKAHPIAPNTSVLLMDSEALKFYIKSADTSGMPLPLRTFEYKEITQTAANKAAESAEANKEDKYITREEFNRRIAEIERKEVKDDE